MVTAAIAPVAAAPAAAAPQAHSSGSVPVTVSTAAAAEQASAPITESLKRMPSVGANSPMDKAKLAKHTESLQAASAPLAKHTESLQAASAPSDAGFADMVREYQDIFELAQFAERALNLAAEGAEAMRFDSLLDELDELDEYSSAVDYCSSGFEQLLLDADAYTARQGLAGIICAEREVQADAMRLPNAALPQSGTASVELPSTPGVDLTTQATTIQAAFKRHLVAHLMLPALAEAYALYNFSAPAPPGRFCRIYGGKNYYDFVYSHPGGDMVPYTHSEVLAHSSSFTNTAPDMPQQAAWNSETGTPADASTSPREVKRTKGKGAAARKAAVVRVAKALQLAREAAIGAKCRVVVLHGVIYYNGSRALAEAEDLKDPYAVPKMDDQGTCAALEVRWLWPTITKETVQLKFAPFGGIKYVHLETASWMPKTGLPMIETYNSATITYLNKTSAVAAEREMDGFIFIGGHVPDSHPHPAIKIKFAGGPVDDDDDDGSDGGMHGMLRQHNDSMYMSRSLNDEGIAALYPAGVDWESMGVWEDDDDEDSVIDL